MARIRSVKPEFWEDESVAMISRDARLLFIATWNMADDQGLLRWSPAYVKSTAFIYDEDLGISEVQDLMSELENAGLLFPYLSGKVPTRQSLAWIPSFPRHQKPNRPQPSKLPPPSLQNTDVRRRYAERDGWVCHLCGDDIDRYNPLTERSTALSMDHLVPKSKGGTDHPNNIKVAHSGCNSGRGARPLELVEQDTEQDTEQFSEQFTDPFTPGEEGRGGERSNTSSAPPQDEYPAAFEAAWELYPRKEGKRAALKAWKARIKAGATPEDLENATRHFETAMRDRRKEHIKVGSTFYGPDDHWRDYIDPASAKPDEAPREHTPGNDQFVA